ncbi:MAG: cytochrome d ubiquinol oxidase subunit II [Gammaproteobacteria bacterium]
MPAALHLFWWLILGGFVAAIAILIGGELGLAALLPYLAKNENERRSILARTPSPISGHVVWLVLLGGAVVGAWWPLFHATLFSGLWLVLLFIIVGVLVGPIGHGYRTLVAERRHGAWDGLWGLASLASLLVMGIGVGTTISGVPLHFDANMNPLWGGFAARFTPYEVLVPGLLAVALGIFLAAARVAGGTEDVIAERAHKLLLPAGVLALLIFIGGAIWATQLTGYAVGYTSSVQALTDPLHGTTFAVSGAYLEQFLGQYPQLTLLGRWPLLIVPIFAGVSLLVALFFSWRGPRSRVWPLVVMAVVGVVATAGATTYPVILPSTSVPAQSLTLWNAAMPTPVLVAYLVWLGVLIPAALIWEIWSRRREASAARLATPGS